MIYSSLHSFLEMIKEFKIGGYLIRIIQNFNQNSILFGVQGLKILLKYVNNTLNKISYVGLR